MQFQIALDMISKIKPTRHTSEFQYDSIIQARKFIKKRLQHRCFLVINAQFLRAPILKIISERLLLKTYPVLLVWILKRISEKNSSLSAFWKIGVLKTSAKFLGNHICWSLFSIKLLTFSVKFY